MPFWSGFQSTRPHGARPLDHFSCSQGKSISIHAPSRGATAALRGKEAALAFQSTRPHGARPSGAAAGAAVGAISIHAPSRGATFDRIARSFASTISIHAPSRGATCASDVTKFIITISIHAPSRGATWGLYTFVKRERFQSTRPHGARLCLFTRA